jgi:hypothetical protein
MTPKGIIPKHIGRITAIAVRTATAISMFWNAFQHFLVLCILSLLSAE